MHEFKYKENYLYCEGVKISDLAGRFGTPLYVYSYKTLIGHYLKLKSARERSLTAVRQAISEIASPLSLLAMTRLLPGAELLLIFGFPLKDCGNDALLKINFTEH